MTSALQRAASPQLLRGHMLKGESNSLVPAGLGSWDMQRQEKNKVNPKKPFLLLSLAFLPDKL